MFFFVYLKHNQVRNRLGQNLTTTDDNNNLSDRNSRHSKRSSATTNVRNVKWRKVMEMCAKNPNCLQVDKKNL